MGVRDREDQGMLAYLPLLEAIGVVQKVRDIRPSDGLCAQVRRLRTQKPKQEKKGKKSGRDWRGVVVVGVFDGVLQHNVPWAVALSKHTILPSSSQDCAFITSNDYHNETHHMACLESCEKQAVDENKI